MKRHLARLSSLFGSAFGMPLSGKPAAAFQRGGRQAALLSAGNNASIAYLLQPHLQELDIPFVVVPVDDARSEIPCSMVIIARYLPRQWIPSLQTFRDAGGKIVYFMDDDLMDPNATEGLPAAYRRKIDLGATRQRRVIESLCEEFWVASPYLAEKYSIWSPHLLTSAPTATTLEQHDPVTICYHGSASHGVEIRWLAKLMQHVQSPAGPTTFEIFGDHEVNKLFRGMSRTSVMHPMDWRNYLAFTSSIKRDIGLAPLLPGSFNAGRAPSKFFDFARMGAVGIYTDVAPYRGFVEHGVDGLLLPNEPDAWIATIRELAANPARRQRLATAARARALAMAGVDDNRINFRKTIGA